MRYSRDYYEKLVANVDKAKSQGLTVVQACQQVGIKWAHYYTAKRTLRGRNTPPAREIVEKSDNGNEELKQLRIENGRLRLLVVEKCLDIQALLEFTGRK